MMKNIFNILNRIFKTDNQKISKILSSNYMFRFNMNSIFRELSNFYSFYKLSSSIDKSYILNTIPKKYIIYNSNELICICYNNKNIVIFIDWKGLSQFYNNIISHKSFIKYYSNEDITLSMIKTDIDRILTNIENKYNDLCILYNNIIIKHSGIEIPVDIIPEKIVCCYNSTVKDIDNSKSIKINRLKIEVDPFGYIISVRIDSKHPNCDKDGFYCLGNLKYSELNKDTIDIIIKSLSYYRLDDYYDHDFWNNRLKWRE